MNSALKSFLGKCSCFTLLPSIHGHMHCSTKWYPCHEDDCQHTTYMDVGSAENAGAVFQPLRPWR